MEFVSAHKKLNESNYDLAAYVFFSHVNTAAKQKNLNSSKSILR